MRRFRENQYVGQAGRDSDSSSPCVGIKIDMYIGRRYRKRQGDSHIIRIVYKKNANGERVMDGQSEFDICVEFMKQVRLAQRLGLAAEHSDVIHIPNGQRAGANVQSRKLQGGRDKRMGARPGVADYMVLWPENIAFLEAKTHKGRQSESQKIFQAECRDRDHKYAIFRSAEEGIETLITWRVIDSNFLN